VIKTIKVEYFLTVNEENFTLCIRDQGSEQEENKAEKCKQHFYDRFSKTLRNRFGRFTFQREALASGSMMV